MGPTIEIKDSKRAVVTEHKLSGVLVMSVALLVLSFSGELDAQRPEILYLRFNAGSGAAATDLAIPGVMGTTPLIQNGAAWDSTNPKLGSSCLDTNAANGGPVGPVCLTGATVNYNGDWTVEMWVRKDTPPGTFGNSLLFGSDLLPKFHIKLLDPTASSDALVLAGNNVNDVVLPINMPQGTWQHVAFVHDRIAQTVTSFVNGVEHEEVGQLSIFGFFGFGPIGLRIGGEAGGNQWQGAIDELRIWNRVLSPAEILGGMSSEAEALAVDVGVIQVTSPIRLPRVFVPFSSSEIVRIRVGNLGLNALPAGTAIPVSYSLDGGTAVSETLVLTAPLTTGESVPFTFASSLDLSGPGTHNLDITAMFSGDQQPINNTRSRTYGGADGHFITEFPYNEDFNPVSPNTVFGPLAWAQDLTDGGDKWAFSNMPISWLPQADHTTGAYGEGFLAYVEGSASSASVNLLGPLVDLRANPNPRLEFWLQNASNARTMSLDLIVFPSGSVIQDVAGPLGANGVSAWFEYGADLSPFQNQIVQPRLRVDASIGPGIVAIDDLHIVDQPIGPGQAPQPGISVMDLNNSMSLGGLAVSFLENGPYFAQATPGGALDFEFEGEPNQAVVLLFGVYNPAAATFPNIGQMDIGGVPDPMSGIPVGVSVIFDGTLTTGINPLFRTNINGVAGLHFLMPAAPPGILTTFQAAMTNSLTGIAIGNAIQLEIQ